MTTKPLNNHPADNHQDADTHTNDSLANIIQWRCMNCGQHIFLSIDMEPPDTCEYCRDMTTWGIIEN